MPNEYWFWLTKLSLLAQPSAALDLPPQEYFQQHPSFQEWISDLHFEESFDGWSSLIENPEFFMNPIGQSSPTEEINTFISEWNRSTQHATELACRFPIRTAWLLKHHPHLNPHQKPIQECEQLKEFRNKFFPVDIEYVFATSYLGHPASMFGHTFLRFNQNDKTEFQAYVIDYAAAIEGSPPMWKYAYDGVVGNFPGRYAILPYYEKIRQYNSIESRSLWRFTLNLDKSQRKRLIDHLWELKAVDAKYYFFDQNCAYNLMRLVEVATQNKKLKISPGHWNFPLDCVHQIFDANLIKKVQLEPSLNKKVFELSKELTDQQILAATRSLQVEPTYLKTLNAHQLELATHWAYFNGRSNMNTLAGYEQVKSDIRAISRARNKLNAIPTPISTSYEHPPSIGHRTQRTSIALTSDHIQVNHRLAYHSLSDPRPGYPLGSGFEALSGSFLIGSNGSARFDKLRFFRFTSLNPTNILFDPLSWNTHFDITSISRPNFHFQLDIGKSRQLTTNSLLYFLPGISLTRSAPTIHYTFGAIASPGNLTLTADYKKDYDISLKSISEVIHLFAGYGLAQLQLFFSADLHLLKQHHTASLGIRFYS